MSVFSRYYHDSSWHAELAFDHWVCQFFTSKNPYQSPTDHVMFMFHGLGHLMKAIINVCRVAQGVFLLLGALLNKPLESVPMVLAGLSLQVGAIVLNVATCALSFLSVVARSFVTLFHLGYAESKLCPTEHAIRVQASSGPSFWDKKLHQTTWQLFDAREDDEEDEEADFESMSQVS